MSCRLNCLYGDYVIHPWEDLNASVLCFWETKSIDQGQLVGSCNLIIYFILLYSHMQTPYLVLHPCNEIYYTVFLDLCTSIPVSHAYG